MAEVHLRIPDNYVHDVRKALNEIWEFSGRPEKLGQRELTPNEIFGEALAVYRWVLEQTKNRNAVVATADFATPREQIQTSSIPAIDPELWKPESKESPSR